MYKNCYNKIKYQTAQNQTFTSLRFHPVCVLWKSVTQQVLNLWSEFQRLRWQ